MRFMIPLLMLACGAPADTSLPEPSLPDRYPRCTPGADEPLVPTLAQLVAWVDKVQTLAAASSEAARTLPAQVPRPPPRDAEQLEGLVRELISSPTRRAGSASTRRALEIAALEAGSAGARVSFGERSVPWWDAIDHELRVDGEVVASGPVVYTAGTGQGAVEGVMAYVGEGRPDDLEGLDLTGRIAVAELVYAEDLPDPDDPFAYAISDPDGSLVDHPGSRLPGLRGNLPGVFYGDAVPQAGSNGVDDVLSGVQAQGAAGLVLLLSQHPADDVTPLGPYDAVQKDLPVLMVPRHAADGVREAALRDAAASVSVRVTQSTQAVRDAWIVLPGRTDDTLILSAHIDAPFRGATEDATGVALVVDQIVGWSQVDVLDRPYTLVALLDDGHFAGAEGARDFARRHPEWVQRAQTWIDVDALGAREARWSDDPGAWTFTGHAERSTLFASHDGPLLTAILAALQDQPPPATRVRTTAGFLPPSDVAGAVVHTSGARPDRALRVDCGVPFVSWGTATPWQLDEHDTIDKVDAEVLARHAETLTALVARLQQTPPWVPEGLDR